MNKKISLIIKSFLDNNNSQEVSSKLIIGFLISYLLIAFLPKGLSIDIMGIQWLYISLINIAIGIIIYYSKEKELEWSKFYFNKVTLLYTTFVALCGISIFFAENQIEGIVSYVKLLTIFCAFLLLSITSNCKKSILLNFSIALTIIFIFEMLPIVLKYYLFNLNSSNKFLSKIIKANSGNVNIMASTIMLKLPFIMYCFFYFKNKRQYFFLVAFLLGTLVLFPTGSRTNIISYVLLILSTISFTIYTKQFKIFKSKIAVFILTAFLGYNVANYTINKEKNTEVIEKKTEKDAIKPIENVNKISGNRLNIWSNTLQVIKEKPITGVGYGNYKIEVIPYESKHRNGWRISKYSHEDFLQIAAESGIFTSLIYIIMFCLCISVSIKKIVSKNTDNEKKWMAFIILMAFITFIIDSLLNFPLYVALTQVHFILLMFFLLNLENNNNKNLKYIKSNLIIGFIILLSCILIIPNYNYLKSLQSQNTVFADSKKMQLSTSKIDKILPNYYPNLNEYGYPIVSLKAKYLIKEKRYDEAIDLLAKTKNINKYIMFNENLLATIYEKKSNYDSVVKYRKMAFEMYPKVENFYINYLEILKKRNNTKELVKAKKYLDKHGSNERFDSIYNQIIKTYNLN